jgi:hypothetical protein
VKVLLELRPAMEGHAGIPQETRLLFRGLGQLPGVQMHGLLQTGGRLLARGLPADEARSRGWTEDRRIDRLSRVVVSLQPEAPRGPWSAGWRSARLAVAAASAAGRSLLGRTVPLGRFEPAGFADFVWRSMFAKTLPAEDFAAVTQARYRIARVPWSGAHSVAAFSRRFGAALYPRLDTRGYEIFVAETPYPGRVAAPTKLVVRYHDAFPLLMPHTIVNRAHHRAAHYEALRRNVLDGAWFACVSEASRRDLLTVFPAAEPRALTIPNMVSHRYFPQSASPGQIVDILGTRANRWVQGRVAELRLDAEAPTAPRRHRGHLDYLLMVATVEPRKNHLGLLAAWEQLRANGHPDLRLVMVGAMGWDQGPIVDRLLPWVGRGLIHVLDDVPASELRLLYSHARITVCPSFGEGFGFSGVEAMRCGGIVAASDLPVHREIYGDAAEYFNPYSSSEMAGAVQRLLGSEAAARRAELQLSGTEVAADYLPERILPRWQEFVKSLA